MTDYQTEVAMVLLKSDVVKLQPTAPFTWASGILSPIYTDNRKTISFPAVRRLIAQGLAELIKREYPDVQVIGGVATAGIPHAAWVAEVLDLPMVYVRSKPKDHGAGQQIEGVVLPGHKVVLIDDLISTGGSVLDAVKATRAAGAEVLGVSAIFSYELPAAMQNFGEAQTPFKALTNYTTLLTVAQQTGTIQTSDLATLREWRQDPQAWQPNN